ncbi:MAG: sugar nucleotide-binding protein [Pseudomonadota bacterium]
MDVLIIGADNPVGVVLQGAFVQWGRHQPLPLNTAASRWRSERQAKKAARKDKPDAVVDLRLAWQLAAGEAIQPIDLERSYWLAKACERSEIHYVLLSTDAVFASNAGRHIRETDTPDTSEEPGATMASLESQIMQGAPTALMLRTGPLFASFDDNLLTRVMDNMSAETTASFDDQLTFSPVATVDAARVIAAMLDQLAVGAQAGGVFHYCAGDRATEYGFAEAALAAASQYMDCSDVSIEAASADSSERGVIRVLDCSRLRDSFAIKQVPWRGFINPVVKQFFQTRSEQQT